MASMQAPAAADNPVYEWLDGGATYFLRLNLPGFKKEDFRVHVDGEGRLTIIGNRKPTPGGDGKALRLHKTFQLPNTANLDTITGRFDNNVLTLTVPKLPAPPLPPPPPSPPQAKAEAPRVAGDKPADQEDKAAKAGQKRTEVERTSLTERSKEEEEKKAKPTAPPPPPPRSSSGRQARAEHREKAKPTAPPPSEKARGDHEQQDHRQDDKARAEHREKAMPTAPPPTTTSEKARGDHEQQDHQQDDKTKAEHREKVSREAARRVEAARARVAEAKARAERERQCEHWKQRAMEEGMKLAEALSKKKEVIATAVAAFTLGVFVSSKLFNGRS